MSVGLNGLGSVLEPHWGCLVALGGSAVAIWLLKVRTGVYRRERLRDKRFREEIEAYVRVDTRLSPGGNAQALGERVCRLVAERSSFYRVALLSIDAAGRPTVAASVGMDPVTIVAVEAWGMAAMEEEHMSGRALWRPQKGALGPRSWAVVLGENRTDPGSGRAIVAPLWSASGQLMGAMVVCADSMLSAPMRAIVETVNPLEILALRLGRAMDNAASAEGAGESVETLGRHENDEDVASTVCVR